MDQPCNVLTADPLTKVSISTMPSLLNTSYLLCIVHFSMLVSTFLLIVLFSILSVVVLLPTLFIALCLSILNISVFFMHPPSFSLLLDRGAPFSEMQTWDLPLPQLPHPFHRHSVPSWFWLSGLWSWL